ncbi:hypothetical protein Clacol_003317 [Clathrus columnatus]|uniref:Alpha-type protein kinase domain-containing protein n=1 Tax=Clathrus columnatus TaxID=1419009 RepID=A0AAV5A7Y7_9AGAM|nr:hypothetical protein Clacol_003317 [Clathrus columnatus]
MGETAMALNNLINQPINPRTPLDLLQFSAPHSQSALTDAVEMQNAHNVIGSLARAYDHAKQGVQQPQLLQSSKLPSSFTSFVPPGLPSKKISTINVHLESINILMCKKQEKLEIIPCTHPFSIETPWSNIISTFAGIVQFELNDQCQITVLLNRISLQNFQSNQIKQYVDESTTKSLGYLWSYITAPRLNFLYIPKTETLKQTPTLQCIAIVTLNDVETLEYTNYLKNLKAIKKVSKASIPSIVQNPVSVGNYISKASGSGRSGPYLTEIVRSENLIIEHFDMRLQSNNVSTLIKSPAQLQMTISCDFKASGQTKHMYDAHIGTNVYAAKCFYNLGIPQTEISAKDNWTHLQNELSRHITATKLGEQFVFAANEKNLALCNFTFSDSWIHGTSGIGDDGEQGIEAFKVQHRCNSLCKALHLPELVCEPRNIKRSRAPSSPTQLLDDNDLTNVDSPKTSSTTPFSSLRKRSHNNSLVSSKKNANLSASSTTPQSTSNNSDILGNETDLTISEISYEFDIEITLWGRGENNNLREVLPRKGEERKGKLKLWVKEGEIYNVKCLQWWKAQMLDTSVATTYAQGFAFSPYAERWPGSTLSAEIQRPVETEDGEGNLIDASYPHNIGTTGIEFWRKSHTCFSTCEALGFTHLV